MKKTKQAILASIAFLAMVAMSAPVMAAPGDHEMPAENDSFWTYFAQMSRPDDTATCLAFASQSVEPYMSQFCSEIANMPTEMEGEMALEGVTSNLFCASDWHNVSNLYFEKSGMGKIQFSSAIDFMSYDFFNFMNNFGDMVQFEDGYISLNSSIIGDMTRYGATLTMYDLDFAELPDIYVTTPGGSTMRKANASDIGSVVYDSATGELSFTPGHFSAFRAVAQGSKVKKMKVSSVKKKTIKYNVGKSTFTITIKGTSLYSASGTTCMLGFNSANVVTSNVKGKKITCQFNMSDFSTKGWYPLTVTASGVGEVKKTNGVKIK